MDLIAKLVIYIPYLSVAGINNNKEGYSWLLPILKLECESSAMNNPQ